MAIAQCKMGSDIELDNLIKPYSSQYDQENEYAPM